MFQRVFQGVTLFSLLVILVSGSQRIYSNNREGRDRRHASCPSCSRDCPDALANWYMPSRNEFRGLGQQISPPAAIQPYQPSLSSYPSPNPYDGAFRSGGAPFESGRDTYKRENSYGYQGRFDSDLAPASTEPIYATAGSLSSYHPSVDRSLGRTAFQRSNFYDAIRPQSDLVSTGGYSSYQASGNVPRSESISRFGPYGDSKNVQVVFRADRYPVDSVEQSGNAPSDYPREYSKDYPSTYGGRSETSLQLQETVPPGCQCQSSPDQFQDSPIVPQISTGSYGYQNQRGQQVDGDSLSTVNYNTRYSAQSVAADDLPIGNSNIYQGQTGVEINGDSLSNANYNTRYQTQPVANQIPSINLYQSQRDQGFEGDSLKTINSGTRYGTPSTARDNLAIVNGDIFQSQTGVGVNEDSSTADYNAGYGRRPVAADEIAIGSPNIHQSQTGVTIGRDLPGNFNCRTRIGVPPVASVELSIGNGNTYQSQAGQKIGGESPYGVNYNNRYGVPPVGRDEVTVVNSNTYQSLRGEDSEGDLYKSANCNTRYQPRAIKVTGINDQSDKLDSRRNLKEEAKEKRDAVGQGILQRIEKTMNVSTEIVPLKKVTETTPQEALPSSTERMMMP